MNLIRKNILFFLILLLSACADFKIDKSKKIKEKKFYSSNGFALIYDVGLLEQGAIDKKLNKGGYFFSYTPSKKSTSWIKEKNRFDNSTLKGFKRPHSPFFNNEGFFRFVYLNEYKKNLMKNKFKIKYMEKTSRTYNNLKEYFEFIIVEAKK